MKQTLTRDGFIHNLQGERNDKNTHNIMILGHAVFDLHDAVKELLERTKDLYHPTDFEGPKIKALKIDPTSDIPQEDEEIESF